MSAETMDPAVTAPPEIAWPRRSWRWPRGMWRRDRTSVAPRATMAAALGAGAIATITLQVTVVSIAYVLTGAAVAVTAFATMRPRPTRLQLGAVLGALALLAVAAVRGAEWLVALCVIASWVVGSVALVGGWTWTGLTLASIALWLTPARVAGWVRRGRGRIRTGRGVKPGRVAAVTTISIVLILVFGSLFVSADPQFAELFDAVVPDVRVTNPVGRLLVGVLFMGAALAAAYLRRRTPRFDALAPRPGRPVARWEWAVPLALLDLLFALFVAVQVRVLFGGDDHVQDTDNLTYADYARQGFWQLTVVTVLTLVVIAAAVRKVDRQARADRPYARLLLGALCFLTLVIVASAVHRMSLYESEFGFTRLRVSVMATELWLGVVFVLLIVAGVRMSARWLPRAVLASAAVGLLGFAALNPDGYIAERNTQRYADTGDIDVGYLRGLSVDAVPALDRLPEPARSCALSGIGVGDDSGWFEYNAARERAREILRARPIGECDSDLRLASSPR